MFHAMLCFSFFFFKLMYNKTIIRFGFSNIRNNQYLSNCFQQRRRPRLITVTCRSTLIIPDITKKSSYNCLKVNPVRQFRVEIENIERFRVNITIDHIMATS